MRAFAKLLMVIAAAGTSSSVCSFAPAAGTVSRRPSAAAKMAAAASDTRDAGTPAAEDATATPPRRRRERYSGRYPRHFKHKYKERRGDDDTIRKVLAKGMTPAGTHVPIMVKECLHYMGLERHSVLEDIEEPPREVTHPPPLLVVDCTLGYGGHSSYILKNLVNAKHGGSRVIAFDQDSAEIKKTEERLRSALNESGLLNRSMDDPDLFTAVNQNFETVGTYLSSTNQAGLVTSLLADLGLSSMQIDDNDRGFTYKRRGPLDMRMNPDDETETAYDLLRRLRPRQLKSLLKENSDEEFAAEIATGLVGRGAKIPETTTELAERVRDVVQPLIEQEKGSGNANKHPTKKLKKQLDSTVARVMQALRIEVNGEFEALESLLRDLPAALSPGGRAVVLTFHSGEDRRVKKAFKAGFNSGAYSAWSRRVVRPSHEERRNNPRSSCCKLRWVVRADDR